MSASISTSRLDYTPNEEPSVPAERTSPEPHNELEGGAHSAQAERASSTNRQNARREDETGIYSGRAIDAIHGRRMQTRCFNGIFGSKTVVNEANDRAHTKYRNAGPGTMPLAEHLAVSLSLSLSLGNSKL
jgi:hypothetical protein